MLSLRTRKEGYIGLDIKRKEDAILIHGRATFLDDIKPVNCLFAGLVRSPYAHARISGVRINSATQRGFNLVTYEDIKDRYAEPVSCQFRRWVKEIKFRCLASRKVRYVGEPIAAVLAAGRYEVEDALENVHVEYDLLRSVTGVEEAQLPGAELVNDEWDSNVAAVLHHESGNVDEAFRSADHVVERSFRVQRHAATPIEPRGCIGDFEPVTGKLTVWSSTHAPHLLRTILANTLLMDENKVRVISPNVGGSFGLKVNPYPEDILIPMLSVMFKRPVKWVETRTENLSSANHGREQINNVRVATKSDGRIVGLQSSLTVDLGAYPTGSGPLEGLNSACYLTGCYEIKNYAFELRGVVTNKAPLGAYRGFGKSAPNFVIERMIDIIAKQLRLDPLAVRARNFVNVFPYKNAAGAVYDSGNYAETLRIAAEMIGYHEFVSERKQRHDGEYVGVGFASSIDPSGGAIKDSPISAYDGVTIRISRKGRVDVFTGACGLIGTGHETTFAQIVADELGVKVGDIEVIEGDTMTCPVGQGSFSDRSLIYAGSAAALAARDLRARILELASFAVSARPNQLDIYNGEISLRDRPEKKITIEDVARLVYHTPYNIPGNLEAKLEATRYFSLRGANFIPSNEPSAYYPCHGNCAHAALVSVDPETGKIRVLKYVVVHDSGRVVNKMIVEGQIHGGVAAGLGGATLEEVSYDSEGRLLSPTFIDYLIPTSMEVPNISGAGVETQSPLTVLGAKGVGESGAIGVYAAVANAVENALARFGVEISSLPLKPERVLRSMQPTRSH